jgi:predicted PurR-regulated permease PerM
MFCITFLELWIGLSLLKIPYELGLAFGIAVFDLMPILGVGGILLPWGGIALVLGNLKMGIGIIALYLVIAAVRNTVEPRIVGKEIGLHPLATLVAMVVGLRLIGLVGMLMLPITMVAIVKLREGSLSEQAH